MSQHVQDQYTIQNFTKTKIKATKSALLALNAQKKLKLPKSPKNLCNGYHTHTYKKHISINPTRATSNK